MLSRFVTVEHPNPALVPCWYVGAATPGTVAQFEPTVGVVVLYPSQLFGVQFAVATPHWRILSSRPRLAPYTNGSNLEHNKDGVDLRNMHCLLTLLLALQPATVLAVLDNQEVLLALRMGDVIYTAEFSRDVLGRDTFIDGDRVGAEVTGGKMRVKRKDGKIVSGRLMWEQRVLVHPIP